jgi:putative PIN family toxin of toxin-antitoxin system
VRAVLDTNIVVAGLLWRGKPYDLIGLAIEDKIRCFASDAMIAELDRVLRYPKLSRRLGAVGSTPSSLFRTF